MVGIILEVDKNEIEQKKVGWEKNNSEETQSIEGIDLGIIEFIGDK